jgi:hypothetical protein
MTGTIQSTTGRWRRARRAITFAALCVALVGVVAVSSAIGARQARVLGKTKHTPAPACPKDCEAVTSVTGFQRVANGEKSPFRVNRNGKLVAWAIDLSRPKKSQRNFFGRLFRGATFGKDPSARLAVIKHKQGRRYKLLRQSPAVNLSGFLGRKQIFTLDRPLNVRKGQIVAFTVPTWAPNFGTGVSRKNNKWRASRSKRRCNTSRLSNAKRSRPHRKVGSVRRYACDYTSARLLYWAYFVRG